MPLIVRSNIHISEHQNLMIEPSLLELSRILGVKLGAEINAADLGPAGNLASFTLAFLDPPYDQCLAERALASAAAGGWLAPGAIAVIEQRKGAAIILPPPLTRVDRRTWGDTEVLFARYRSAPASS